MLVRDYCDQKLDEGLNIMVDGFLRRLNELQERLRERDAIKAKMKRRLQVLPPIPGSTRKLETLSHNWPLGRMFLFFMHRWSSSNKLKKKMNKNWLFRQAYGKYTGLSALKKPTLCSSPPTSSPVRYASSHAQSPPPLSRTNCTMHHTVLTTHTHVHTCTYTHAHICTHTHTHTHRAKGALTTR